MALHPEILNVTQAIVDRSVQSRQRYLALIAKQQSHQRPRESLSCGNLAHTIAAMPCEQKHHILDYTRANIGIVSAYNDMVSAHQPYADYPKQIKKVLHKAGHSAQVAGGVPAMCDGVTQGQVGMDLSLFSRDHIAQATAIALSHNTFDGALLLGVCDKIAPGQLIGAAAFGHLPIAFVPSGPMATGISNDEKVATRQRFVAGQADRAALLEMECQSYHSPGTCTFYGTANSNQLVFEAMGLMLPGSAFIPPTSRLRERLTEKVALHIAALSTQPNHGKSLAEVVDEKSVVNGLVALLASGGSTNHTIHLIAIANSFGWCVTWDDIQALSSHVPLLANLYPNGSKDINAFQQEGAVPALLTQLNKRHLIHMDANPLYGTMQDALTSPSLDSQQELSFAAVKENHEHIVIAKENESFSPQGGLKLFSGNLGRGIMKVSAASQKHWHIRAPARVFNSQHDVERAYHAGEFTQDTIIVVRFNGPSANGMPELHKLMPILGNLLQQGHEVALVTDGRLSGASGKVPAVIHVCPEAQKGGPLAFLQDGDEIEMNAFTGELLLHSSLDNRQAAELNEHENTFGRGLFSLFRQHVSSAEQGATIFTYSHENT